MTEPMTGPITFEPGDVVELKSGGPAMTVVGVQEDGVHCLWYAEAAGEVKTAVVPAICVEKAIPWEDEGEDDAEEDDGKHKKHGKKKRHDDD